MKIFLELFRSVSIVSNFWFETPRNIPEIHEIPLEFQEGFRESQVVSTHFRELPERFEAFFRNVPERFRDSKGDLEDFKVRPWSCLNLFETKNEEKKTDSKRMKSCGSVPGVLLGGLTMFWGFNGIPKDIQVCSKEFQGHCRRIS